MKKTWSMMLGRLCYILGVFSALYVGGWLMLIKPIHTIITAFGTASFTLPMLLICIIKIAFSTTFAGLVWCIGYIGYNHFKGTEDPDWAAIEERWKQKKAEKLAKEKKA